ncbi:MAG: AI-2E family transporter [Deltaproteobacteria bacterium]
MPDASSRAAIIIIAVVAACSALSWASAVFAPLAFALFIISLLWPLQSRLQSVLPKLVALLISLGVLITGLLVLGTLTGWSVSRAGQALASDAARLQSLYEQLLTWLEGHGIAVAALWSEHINIGWYIRLLQSVISRLNSTLSFWLIVLVYVTLGLLEVDDFASRIKRFSNGELARALLDGSRATATKFRAYFLMRTKMSILTGLLVFAVTYTLGLPLAGEWGILAFVLNYIPFLGPLFSTLFPTLYAVTEFQSWETPILIFLLLNVIQIAVGSYIEPRVSGAALAISPLLVLFSVFFWSYLWGIFGAFIGVPISIAILTYCDQIPSARWLAELFGAPGQRAS